MEKRKYINNIYIYLVMIFYNMNFASITYSSFIMRDFSKISWIIPILTIIPIFILILLYKTKNKVEYLQNIILFKILLLINSIIHNTVLIYVSSQMMGISFYQLTPVSIFALISIVLTCFLSFLDINKLLRLALILITGLIWFVPFIFDFEYNNNLNMELFGKIDFKIIKGLYYTTICNDLFLYTLYNKEYKYPITKKALLIVSSIIMIIASLQIIDSFTLVNYRYYEGLTMPSLNRYFSHQGKRFFEHFDILLLFLTMTTTFYKVPFNAILVKNTLNKKYQTKFLLLYFFFLTPLVFFLILNYNYLRFFLLLLSITTFLLTIIIIIYSRKGENNVSTVNPTN